MRFDSHVERLLQVTVRLVNALTPGRFGGREVLPVGEQELPTTVAGCLALDGRASECSPADAALLLDYAQAARTVIGAVEANDLASAAATVNRLLLQTGARPQLDQHERGWHLHFHGTTDSVGTGWAAGGAAALALVIGSDLAGRLGICAAPNCDRVYLDLSRNGSRTFCSATCQSRVKAAAYRQRTRETP